MLLYASVKSTEDKLPFESTATTLANYVAVFTSPATLPIFFDTFIFTVGSLAVGLPAAILLAWLLERTAIPARAWVANLILVPMTIPSLLSAIAWIQLLDPRIGLVNVIFRGITDSSSDTGPFDIYTLTGMCFVQGLRLVPSAYLMIAASFRAMDPSLEEQSAMAGQNVARTTLRVTLPIMRPALLAALIYFIIVVIESFDIPGLLGFTARIRVLSTAIYWATHSEVGLPDYGLASALGAIILVAALMLMWIYRRLTLHQERFATVTGKGYRPRQINLGPWTAPAFGFVFSMCVGGGAAVCDVTLDEHSAILYTAVGGIFAPRNAGRLRQHLAGRQRHTRGFEYPGAGAGDVPSNDFAGASRQLVRCAATPAGADGKLSRDGFVFTSMRAKHRHRARAYFRLRALSDTDLRYALDYRAGDDHALSGLQFARNHCFADSGARRIGGGIADGRRTMEQDSATDHDAAFGAGDDQRVSLGCGARDARAVHGADAVHSGHGRDLNDDMEHVAKRPHHGRGSPRGGADSALRRFAARRSSRCGPARRRRGKLVCFVSSIRQPTKETPPLICSEIAHLASGNCVCAAWALSGAVLVSDVSTSLAPGD